MTNNIPVFTSDWFSSNIPIWTELLKGYKNKPNLKFLEIGVFEGRSTLWLLENILTHRKAKTLVIDTFKGNGDYQKKVFTKKLKSNYLRCIFIKNTKEYRKKIIIKTGESQKILRGFKPKPQYDFIYIDGSHKATDVLEDSILTFRLLKSNGIIIWDDYEWNGHKNPYLCPKLGIDSFLKTFKRQYDFIHQGYQVGIRKK